ncbi:MAG TPA: metallophosphoesterase [Acidimicrobiales bacterium]|nr:metallophosphoesterase [Acidimicrobiales bacterium]
MIRVAAFGDVHVGRDSAGALAPHLSQVPELADVLIVAGDLTRYGTVEETKVLVGELEAVVASGLPVVSVLGNHDHHSDQPEEVASLLEEAGITVLEGEAVTVDVDGELLGVAGAKGFGGGFTGASGSDFGEAAMKGFMQHSRAAAEGLARALGALETDRRVAVTHYSPVPDTLVGERLEIYPFLGSSYLAEAIDAVGADLALHGHAHNGTEQGVTPGGVPVRNVAQPVIRQAYRVYCLGEE